ncbi:MAG: redox-regulated ATPase YchF [Alphaproteobacteria bacterium]|nr:redox-regulated ATPase YchF [Alphaproteobacteria bacterium]
MGFNCGIVGLPNVGKSTLFNALTATVAADAANYPFCTIEPNTGMVVVPDATLNKLGDLVKSAKIIPTQMEIVDIAGLVKGASAGEGLGNKFLSHIRAVDAIIHMVRCFENDDITHVAGRIDPLADIDIIETELMLADIESLDRQVDGLMKRARGLDKEAKLALELLKDVKAGLENGIPARDTPKPQTHEHINFNLLTEKPVMFVCNVDEADARDGNAFSAAVIDKYGATNPVLIISSKIEQEIAMLDDLSERELFLNDIGLSESGLSRVIRSGYDLLGLQTFYTVGPKETRAWTVRTGATAPNAAGKIHTDFEKGFIRAEIIRPEDYLSLGSEAAVKDAGKMKLVGKDYVMQPFDICHFLFNN